MTRGNARPGSIHIDASLVENQATMLLAAHFRRGSVALTPQASLPKGLRIAMTCDVTGGSEGKANYPDQR